MFIYDTKVIHFSLCKSLHPGTYKSEENQLLLKVYQVKGPTEHYLSKFKNDNWAMDGYVSTFHIRHLKDEQSFLHVSVNL